MVLQGYRPAGAQICICGSRVLQIYRSDGAGKWWSGARGSTRMPPRWGSGYVFKGPGSTNMPLLTELGNGGRGRAFYKYTAPSGAGAQPREGRHLCRRDSQPVRGHRRNHSTRFLPPQALPNTRPASACREIPLTCISRQKRDQIPVDRIAEQPPETPLHRRPPGVTRPLMNSPCSSQKPNRSQITLNSVDIQIRILTC